ncbi:calpain-8-like [Mixophyes fleayi]|uniref:calpain-8-like n=1 Tax=Mixophyes fleayi TaxID=3061075 RepID=UPI003F4DB78B
MASIAASLAKNRNKSLGVGTNKNPVKYLNQDFEELRAQCLASKTLFEDAAFPACQSSLGVSDLGPNSPKVQGLVWKRPSDIKLNPQFIHEGANRADVRQGSLGDCWFLCSIASLTLNEVCLYRVVPVDQSFTKSYAGIFHFKLWQYGEWVDVVVDDRLPTKKGKLLFLKSTTDNEFWSALLEKAYAKLNGSYEALQGGEPMEALEDFTGGVGEWYLCKKAPKDLFQIIQKALKAKSLIACGTKSDVAVGEIIMKNNVVKNHGYSLTGAEEVTYRGGTVQLVRVRNPWGYKEWNGAWSDNAPEWNEVDRRVKAELCNQCDDGEAWFPFSSFLVEFYKMQICHLNLDYACSADKHNWCLTEFKGKWTAGSTAGGCKEFPTYWTNPQFQVTLKPPDNDRRGGKDALCTIIVCLMQKERRKRRAYGEDLFNIGYDIYKMPKEKVGERISSCAELRDSGTYVRLQLERKQPLLNSAPDPESQNGFEDHYEEKEEFNVEELRNVLQKRLLQCPDIRSDGFTLRTCREMINLLDEDNTGTLSNGEFNILWMKLENYMKIFLEVDTNLTGTVDAYELRNALLKAGFNLNNRIQDVIVQRFVSKELSIHFEDFIACMMRLETLLKMFHLLDTNKSGNISLSVSEWLCAGLM